MAVDETLAEDVDERGLDRRAIIKRAAIVGTAAWAAPAIIGSLASPAGALSAPKGCFRFKFNTDPSSHGGAVCQVVSYASSSCEPSSSLCSPDSVTSLSSGTNLSTYCITQNLGSQGSCSRTTNATFTINNACSCTFLGGRFIATRIGGSTSGCAGTVCVTGSGANTKTMSFTLPSPCAGSGNDNYQWEQARIIFRCG